MTVKRLGLVLALTLCFAWSALAAPLSKKQIKKLKQELGQQISAGNWDGVGEKIKALGEADDPKIWKVMVKVVEKSPPEEQLELSLADAASKMTSKKSLKAIEKTALKSRQSRIRRVLVSSLARLKNWSGLIGALKDKDEQTAAMAAWALIDNKVEEGVKPMIDLLGKLEGKRAGIWDVLHKGLGRMLGQKCNSAIEYLSRWEHVQSTGGLAAVKQPEKGHGGGESGGTMVRVKLFGSEIDCTRVVFILDVSGSMKVVDPDQQSYDGDDDGMTKTRKKAKSNDVGGSQGGEGEEVDPNLKTRLERAQRQLVQVIKKLPANFKINIVAYSSRVKIWPLSAKDTSGTPQLLPLTPSNRKAAIEFVNSFKAHGVTATDTALRRAYEIEGARCFYLLSDGKATHDGSGTDVPTEAMLEVLEEFKAKHVTVHTLGFKGADVEMMKAVAEKGTGTYTDIK
jgi:VWA domain-containing protein